MGWEWENDCIRLNGDVAQSVSHRIMIEHTEGFCSCGGGTVTTRCGCVSSEAKKVLKVF